MELTDYFKRTKGTGILSTSDDSGNVDVAVYPVRPHMVDETTMVLIMERGNPLRNLQTNPCAVFVFLELEARLQGKRLYVRHTRLEKEVGVGFSPKSKKYSAQSAVERFLVYFEVQEAKPLVTAGE
jgi:hypothetical protein